MCATNYQNHPWKAVFYPTRKDTRVEADWPLQTLNSKFSLSKRLGGGPWSDTSYYFKWISIKRGAMSGFRINLEVMAEFGSDKEKELEAIMITRAEESDKKRA